MAAGNVRTLEAQIDGAPTSVNRMYRRGRRGQVFLSDEAAAWEMTLLAQVRADTDWQAFHAAWEREGRPRVAVEITLWGVRGDVDNYAKATLDGLKIALGIDDRHFSPVRMLRGDVRRTGYQQRYRGATIRVALPPSLPLPRSEWSTAPALPATQILPALPPGRMRAADLVEPETLARVRERLFPPVEHVQVHRAEGYGALVLLFPPSPLAEQGRDSEWGTFLPLQQARELRDALVAALGSGAGVEE